MKAHNYKKEILQKRNAHGAFEGNRLKSSHVVGKVVEQCFGVVFAPAPGALKRLDALQAMDFPSVQMHDVMAPGSRKPATITVGVEEEDANLAIKVARAVHAKLVGAPYDLEIQTAIYRLAGLLEHDLLAHTRPGSHLAKGLWSVELACAEVGLKNPRTHNWMGKMYGKALNKWHAEVAASPVGTFAGRILVFVQLTQPRHNSAQRFWTHASAVKPTSVDFEVLWGWNGFPRPSQQATSQHVTPSVPAAANLSQDVVMPAASAPAVTTVAPPAAERRWASLIRGKVKHLEWIQLSDFLTMVGEDANQSLRYVDGRNKTRVWKVGKSRGPLPKIKVDWDYINGKHGGGRGKGLPHGRVAFLSEGENLVAA